MKTNSINPKDYAAITVLAGFLLLSGAAVYAAWVLRGGLALVVVIGVVLVVAGTWSFYRD